MTDDRRERYAAAMAAANDGGPEWAYEWYPEADAAMAVADEEVSRAVGDRAALVFENARLAARVRSAEAAHRAVWAKHQERGARIFELQGEKGELREEITRLREEIGSDVNGVCTGMHADVAEAHAAWEEEREANARLRAELEENTGVIRALRRQRDTAEATVARVRAVVDGTSWASNFKDRVRAALTPAPVANPSRTRVED
ncbi:hypothetical protein [Streptomyces sparsogenes]|uniref:hypothetical protein n=1 Tax=Streptomyces sparsogenes TaxID=67365 RepID=UPI003400D218